MNMGQILEPATGQISEEIFKFSWKMKTENYAEDTIARYTKILATLSKRGADLFNPESVREIITRQPWDNGTKQNATNAVMLFFVYHGITATLPTYRRVEKMIFIPMESEIDQLVSGCKHRLATFIQTLKETAARYGEALDLKWTDLNTEAMTLAITPEKGSNPRTVRITTHLMLMLNALQKTSQRIFDYASKDIVRKNFQRARKRIAENLGNPRIRQIHFHTLRHWRATQELRRTNNIWCVMKLLGHKSLSNTQKYIHLLGDIGEEYVAQIAHNALEAVKLIEAGYVFVQTIGAEHLYRKLK